jgi:mannose-6-phosphate isomerase-like protein (cupin superfamily)
MEEATGAPSSLTDWNPKRLRASGRDGETVMTEPPSPLRMLLSRHTKRIVVKPGSKLSLQKHFHRSEHWVVVKGTAEVTLGSDVRSVHENESIYIPIGSVHRLANPGKIPLELIEVQVGSYLGEDDIVRMADVYGRVV